MSPRHGGEADKFGNRYEGAWTVRHLLYVLLGTAQSVTVEDIDDLAEGAEFTFRHGGTVEVHQLKRQNGNANSWTVQSLQDKQIWQKVRPHVEAGRHFHFVSTVPARPLQELSDRARRAENLISFVNSWLTKELQESFNDLTSTSGFGSAEVAWNVLRGFWVEWPDERDINKMNATLAELLLEGAVGSLAAVGLGDLVTNNLGTCLNAAAIENRLSEYGLRRTQMLPSPAIIERVNSIAAGWMAGIDRELLQPTIVRPEANRLADILGGHDNLILLIGAAGGGKSAVLHQVVRMLETDAVPVLGFRLDHLEPFSSTTELGNRLGLDVSPVTALAGVAGERPSILVVDQLDAVSLTSGRMPRNFDAIANLVREASAFFNMRVVLACRKFDVENDYRMRELVKDKSSAQVEVAELSESQVAEAVREMGLDAAALDARQKKLLRSPLNLVLLKSIADDADPLSFQTMKNLFDAFWQRKLVDCVQRRVGTVRFNEVVSTLADAISSRQRLSVPVTVLDRNDLSVDAGVLVSEHVLVRDGQQIAFFHESFFDYAFARGWIERNQTLVEFLTSGDQELFRRAQVRQIMNHLRELEPDRFVTEVEALLSSPGVRFHIKDVALAILGSLSEPTAAEWDMVARVLDAHAPFEDRLWLCLRTAPWFERLDVDGVIEAWLAGGEESEQSQALGIMAGSAKQQPDRMAQLLQPHTHRVTYPSWLRRVTRFADVHQSRALFDLILDAVRSGQYENAERELWVSVHGLGEHQPAWAVELLAAHLVDRPDALALDSAGQVAALLDQEHGAIELAKLGAAGAPLLFCNLFVPYMLRVMALTAYEPKDERPIMDRHFSDRYPNTKACELEDALLFGTATAIRTLTEQDPGEARPVLEALAVDPHEAAQWLLYEGFRTAGETFAQWAADLMLDGVHRFMSGYSSNSVWTARQVLQATSSFISEESFQRLEGAILDLRFPWEKRRPGLYSFNLLSAMDEARLSEMGRRRLGELRRALEMDQPPEPEGVTGGLIAPPIPREAAQHMTDDQWLKAMAKHSAERTDWHTFTGGAEEQSQVLKDYTAKDPARFARLALRLTDSTHPAYGGAILLGLGEASILPDPAPIFEAVRHIASLSRPSNDRWLGWALRRYLKTVPQDLVEIIIDRAISADDPADGRLGVQRSNGEHTGGEDVFMSGFNTARGQSAEVLGDLLVYDPDGARTALVLPVLKCMAEDPAITVRSCVAHVIAASMRHARPQALEAFDRLIQTDDILLATRTVERLIAHIGYGDPAVVEPVIQRMLDSSVFETRESGGRLAAVAAMQWGIRHLLDFVLDSADVASRKGAAGVCAHLLSNTSDAAVAQQALDQFVNDPEEDVRKAAAEVVAALRGERLRPFSRSLSNLIESATFPHALPQLLITLEKAPDRVDDLALKCSRRFIDVHGADTGDIRTRAAGDAQHVGELLVRAYAQTTSRTSRVKVLDLLDQLLALSAYGVADVVGASER